MPTTATKAIVRPLKFQERPAFVRAESAFDVVSPGVGIRETSGSVATTDAAASTTEHGPPWFLGRDVSESLRLAATIARAAERAVLATRPFSWGYGATDGATAHNNSKIVVPIKRAAFFRHETVRSVSAGNRLSLFLAGS